MANITINGISIDPTAQRSALTTAGLDSLDSTRSNYILVQTTVSLDRAKKSELADLGVEILEFVPESTYICRYEPSDLSAIQALAYVEWANIYLEGFKVSPKLRNSSSRGNEDLLSLRALDHSMANQLKQVEIIFHKNVSIDDELRNQVAAATRLSPNDLQFSRHSIRLSVQSQYLEDVAAIDQVQRIEEYISPQLFNNVAIELLRVEQVHTNSGFEGEGQVIAVADTGFDRGSTTDAHPAFTGRVEKLYPLGRATSNDPDGHGTHVAGSVLGDGNSATMGGPIRGSAPKAKLVLQSVLDSRGGLGGLPFDLNNLFKVPYDDGARVHTNSWGAAVSGAYTSDSNNVDEFVWDNRDLVICFAAGNSGEDFDGDGAINHGSIGAPGTAKNCITVGATENDRPSQSKPYSMLGSSFPVAPISTDGWSDNPEGMAAFSSRGPTQNERIKPDVVAPGTAILSAHSRDANIDSFFGTSSDPLYAFLAGTSMATPLVAGCAAVVREYFQKTHSVNPSAALVKAMLINGAKDIVGQYILSEAGDIPNESEGFGRVDLATTISDDGLLVFKDEATELDTGDEEVTSITVASAGSTLKATLVWTDLPGEALQNDLDLIVSNSAGQERHGNVAATSTNFDRRNNVEQVIWDRLPSGNVEVVVRAHRSLAAQSYALVIRVEEGTRLPQELEIDGPEIMGEINPGGEIDLYMFNVTTAGTYTIETSGSTDTFLALFGPNNPTNFIARDDDSGPGLLSRIQRSLVIGTYFVRVRLYHSAQTGPYGVRVRSGS